MSTKNPNFARRYNLEHKKQPDSKINVEVFFFTPQHLTLSLITTHRHLTLNPKRQVL